MIRLPFISRLGILGFGAILTLAHLGRAQPPPQDGPPQQAGVDVLARGPVHEAFAALAIRQPRSSPIIPKQPPQLIEELVPDQKPEGENAQWIPGYWAWNDETGDFLWVSGTYRLVPPGRHWVPGYFTETQGGWQWIPGFWDDQGKNDLELLPPPPDPIEESIPPPPAEASIYQPGCWIYHSGRYMWRSGFYTPYRPQWTWTSACYYWTPGGYIFNDGYWDYPWHQRGLLFAPVVFTGRTWLQQGWSYRPSYLVNDGFLLGSLFERPSYHQYYFGDYYDSRYDRMGFIPWTNSRYGRNVGDPLFAYYQLYNQGNPTWSRDQRQLYAARRADVSVRPPRTLVQQNTVIQSFNNRTITTNNVVNVNNMSAVAHLTNVDRTRVRLQPVVQSQHVEAQKVAQQFREFSSQRGKLEGQARTTNQVPVAGGELAKPVKVKLPGTRPAPVKPPDGPKANLPPARPTIPEPKGRTNPTPQLPDRPPLPMPPGKPPVNTPRPPGKPPVNTPQPPGKPPVNTPQPPGKPPVNTPQPPGKPPKTDPPGKPPVPMPMPPGKPPKTDPPGKPPKEPKPGKPPMPPKPDKS